MIEKLNLIDYVDTIADGNSVQQPKPAPDLFLHAAKLLELDPAVGCILADLY